MESGETLLQIVQQSPTATHEVRVGTIIIGEKTVVVNLIRSKNIVGGDFLPTKVIVDGTTVWNFKFDKPDDFFGLARLYKIGDEPVIVLETKTTIEDVVSLVDLAKRVKMKIGGSDVWYGGRNPEKMFDLKTEVARQLGLKFEHSIADDRIYRAKLEKARQDRIAAEKAAAEKELRLQEKKRQEREERRKEIRSREQVKVFLEDGRRISGIPVIDDEWMSLADSTPAILFASRNQEGEFILPQEAFFVGKDGSDNIKKNTKKNITLDDPKSIVVISMIDVPGIPYEIPLMTETMLKKAIDAGVNGGNYFAIAREDGGISKVVTVDRGKIVEKV